MGQKVSDEHCSPLDHDLHFLDNLLISSILMKTFLPSWMTIQVEVNCWGTG